MIRLSIPVLLFLLIYPCSDISAQFARYVPVDIPVRDGKKLAADAYYNHAEIPKPVILVQTPYNKNYYRLSITLPAPGGGSFPYDSAHYNYVILDWRGFYGSTGATVAGYDRGLDGYDVVEWIAQQPWSDGKIGTWGPSALGMIQFQTARRQPPHLVCSVPVVKDYRTKYTDYYYGGVFREEHVSAMERLGFLTTSLVKSVPLYNAVWRTIERDNDYAGEITVPMLLISGWFDHYPDDVIRAYHDLRDRGDPAVRAAHRLIMGPWEHSSIGRSKQGELEFPGGVGVADVQALRFFDYHLRGIENGWPATPPIRYYQLGEDAWKVTDDWYGMSGETTTLYLHEDGTLRREIPTGADVSTIVYDPRDPSPSHGGARFNPFDPTVQVGPLDIRQVVERRSDALLFTTVEMTEDLHITGPVSVTLFVSSDRTDTDFSVRLCDVHPDGRSMIMTDGIRRARFRNGFEREEMMIPEQVYQVTVELQHIALTLRKGHRLRAVISSSDWPRFDRNLNNGGPMYIEGDTLVATNRVYHQPSRASFIRLKTSPPTTRYERFDGSCFFFLQSYPNPARDMSIMTFSLSEHGWVSLRVSDALGRLVAVPVDEELPPGRHSFGLNTSSLPPGAYQCRLQTRQDSRTIPLIVIR